MRTIAIAGCLIGTLVGACIEPTLDGHEQEIVNGLPTIGFPTVVQVFQANVVNPKPTDRSCTGVLITSSTVLTAAHCVTPGARHVTSAFTGTATVHPQWTGGAAHDLAVVKTLDKVGRPHARLRTTTPEGAAITLVGYGKTVYGGVQDGVKRYGYNVIDRVDANSFFYDTSLASPAPEEAATCSGDSGGPAFLRTDETCVVGITRGQNATAATACTAAGEEWRHTRVDVDLVWLEQVTRETLTLCP